VNQQSLPGRIERTTKKLSSAGVVVLGVAGCTAPSAVPASEPTPVVAPPVPSEGGTEQDVRTREDAKAAVTELAERLQGVEDACREGSARPCEPKDFEDLATRYLAYFAKRDDPHRGEGRIDALPRFSAPGRTAASMSERIAEACVERCDIARRGARADMKGVAVELCATRPEEGRKLCATFAAKLPREDADTFSSSCLAGCERAADEHREEVERERRRPRNKAQSTACFRTCIIRCTGGRVVPAADGTYRRDPNDWCGTCDVSCHAECSVAQP